MALVDTVTSLLDAYGVDVTLQKRSVAAYSPLADIVSANNTEETARCVVISRASQRQGETDSRNVQNVSLFFGPSPLVEIGDRFLLSGKTHAIESVSEIAISGNVVGFKVTAAR